MTTNIKYLVGNTKVNNIPFKPFAQETINFLDHLSKEIKKINNIKNFPDLMSLSFWCRRNNIEKLKKTHLTSENRLGLGLIFHITPSNIPTNFAYSLIFGLITGNANVVKVPSKNFEQITIICKLIKKIVKKQNNFIKDKITIVQYTKQDEYTKYISSICNGRIIWGGDKTINQIRDFKLNERAIELTFADRYSFCIMNSSKISKLSDIELYNLAIKFYNDTYLVDQNACSSPHSILWLGKTDDKSINIFWNKLYEVVKKKYDLTDSAAVDKYTDLCIYSSKLKNIKKIINKENLIYRIQLKNINEENHLLRGKWGLFFEYKISHLNKIKKIINKKYQTLTYYGVDKDKLRDFIINNNLQGIDRVVPVGQGLDIGLQWDGFDIVSTMSRKIVIT
tara:strand:+ start:3238 stop:4419 length:1182 start_codon:yes stop_codon:yes gene_type:complete